MPGLSWATISRETKLPCWMSARYGDRKPRKRRCLIVWTPLASCAAAEGAAEEAAEAAGAIGAALEAEAGAACASVLVSCARLATGSTIKRFFDAHPARQASSRNSDVNDVTADTPLAADRRPEWEGSGRGGGGAI